VSLSVGSAVCASTGEVETGGVIKVMAAFFKNGGDSHTAPLNQKFRGPSPGGHRVKEGKKHVCLSCLWVVSLSLKKVPSEGNLGKRKEKGETHSLFLLPP